MSDRSNKEFRRLNSRFMEDLKIGLLSPLKDLVKKDNSLSLEIRNNYINIYYRGGNLLKLSEIKEHIYSSFFDVNYVRKKDSFLNGLPQEISLVRHLESWLERLPLLKSEMDFWFSKNTKAEREFQQTVVWENNNSSVANSTDYFIADIEYDNKRGGRFDMVAIQWNSDMGARKLQAGYKPKLCFIEMKYGDSALGGKSGMLDHVKQWREYLSVDKKREEIKDEIQKLFQQKRELGLINGLEGNTNEIRDFAGEIDCIFLLANHGPDKSRLDEIIRNLEQINIPSVEIKFCVSNFMGYGLYKENVINLAEFREKYARQIYSKR